MEIIPENIENYISKYASGETNVLAELERYTHANVLLPNMLSGKAQGIFLQLFSAAVQPKYILEIGTFTGYSAICLAKGLQNGGQLFTIDVNEELESVAKKFWNKAGLDDKITIIIGDAQIEIPKLDYQFDIIFIDADKKNYSLYYDLVIDKIKPNGFILADNVLWKGKIINEQKDKDTEALHLFNEKIAQDNRVENVILSIRDGINIIRKKTTNEN
ncbi:MAG TPA: O-methyltransferase [Chitinophagales bacterium]|nr:O-methyltransferase [Bacteroidota bacterium]MCB9075020.1 O-methyltransferase [Chitinophagales bacterium]HMV03150.1 O-methyltransferase [Chitinophagales bacterium]HMY43396.1 O-methyltransferase [Chitinophagales bacterium]HMZ68251.1 O-methyltransferase [Chitinophagales bacterium]